MAQSPNLFQGPEAVETADLHFKLFCKLKIFETDTKYEGGHSSVLAVSQYYGLIFVGHRNGFSVIKTKSLSPTIHCENFPKRDVVLNLRPTHISVDYTQKILTIVGSSKPGSVLIFYNIQSFAHKDIAPLKITPVVKLVQNLAAEVVDLTWQPNADGSLMICLSDGSVLALSQGVKDGPVFTLPSTTQATCFCWSPKGKQIIIGTAAGTLSQYKPDLKVVKTLPSPPLFNGAVMVVSVLWISNYQFAVAYNDRADPESFPVITIVNAAKNELVNIINYDDITYSSTLFRNHQIYMSHQSAWNLIFVCSANSIEVAVLHSTDGLSWEQWLLGDASRAELPLNSDRQETFPLGWAFDFTSQDTIPWGEGTLPPMPRLLLASDEGILCVFNIVNTAENAPQLCAPPKENLNDSLFVSSSKPSPPSVVELPKPVPATKSSLDSPSTFEMSKPSYTFQTSPGFGGFSVTKPDVPQGTPVLLQQQKPLQQPQLRLQQQPQQPFIVPTLFTSSTTTLKVSALQFVTSVFTFGTNSTLTSKPTMTGNTAVKSSSTSQLLDQQTIALTLEFPATQEDLNGEKNIPNSYPVKETVDKPFVNLCITTSGNKKTEEIVEGIAKIEEMPAKADSPGPGTPELAAVDDSVYISALEEEIEHFNSELQQLSVKVGKLDFYVGSEEDKEKLKRDMDALYDFRKELQETTKGQSAEIHTVMMDLMEAFAWLEDAKSRNLQRKNPSYIELKKSEELDPLSARHMSEIGHLKYYIENQLKQLTSYLEKEWMDYQENYRNEVNQHEKEQSFGLTEFFPVKQRQRSQLVVPPLEEVYKTMHYQLKILHKQKALVEELKEKIALKKRNKSQSFSISAPNPVSARNTANRVSELSKLAENLLQLKINKEENCPHRGAWEMIKTQLSAISERSKKLTREKQNALRDALSECDMVKIRPVKTTLESSSFLRSLALEKIAQKTTKPKSKSPKSEKPTIETKTVDISKVDEKPQEKPKIEVQPKVEQSNVVPEAKTTVPETMDKSALASLSGIVSSIGKKDDSTSQTKFIFGSLNFKPQNPLLTFGSVQKQDKPKTPHRFTFGAEPISGKKDFTVFNSKPIFEKPTTAPNTKSETTKTTVPTTVSSPFTFNATTTAITTLPKINLFSKKEPTSGFGTSVSTANIFTVTPTTANLFAGTTTTSQTPASSVFGSGTFVFGSKTATTATVFGTPKTSEGAVQPSGFTFTTTVEKPPATVAAAIVKSTSETEEVDVLSDSVKKPETPENPKESPKASPTSIFGSPTLTITISTPTVAVASTPETTKLVTTTVAAPLVSSAETSTTIVTAATTPTTSSSFSFATGTTLQTFGQTTTTNYVFKQAPVNTVFQKPIFGGSTPSTLTTNIFGGSTPTKPIFGQAATTTPTTFGQVSSPSTPTTFGQVSSPSTPTTFGQVSSPSTPTTFGQVSSPSTPTTFGQVSSPSTPTTFGQVSSPSTPTTFGQVSSPSTPTTFGQVSPSTPTTFGQVSSPSTPTTFGKPDPVAQTASLFGPLLSDSNRPLFGSSTATTTAANIFNKNIFGGGPSTFGTTSSSIFPQTTSVFGQPTTSSSIFGQAQTSPSNSFFGQNICSPFGGTSVTSSQSTFDNSGFNKPIFGQSTFGQTTNNTNTFGGSQTSSLFGNTSTTSGGNVFPTRTTSTTFGSTSPGPFSGGASTFGKSSFGSTPGTFQKPLGGFGSPPVFGGSPAFGGSPTFSGSPSFGLFGSTQSTFGETTGPTTFENLANQNTVGFENLAQQSQSQGFGGGFGSPSFENKPAFGGNSFSSWRSK